MEPMDALGQRISSAYATACHCYLKLALPLTIDPISQPGWSLMEQKCFLEWYAPRLLAKASRHAALAKELASEAETRWLNGETEGTAAFNEWLQKYLVFVAPRQDQEYITEVEDSAILHTADDLRWHTAEQVLALTEMFEREVARAKAKARPSPRIEK